MADYWKSQPKKFCMYCKCWIADNKPSIEFHERGKNHKENVVKKIAEIKQKSVAKAKQDEKMSKEFAAMEEAALKAYEEDLKRLEGTQPAPLVGPTIEERRARDEQKRKEIEALEKHHAKKQWTKTFSPEGYPYYYNLLTRETQWEEPDGFQEKEDKSEEQGPKSVWVEGVSEEGYTYYYNTETGESRWEKPEAFDSALPSTESKETSPATEETEAADEEIDGQELKTESTSDESNPSEETTPAPSVTKTPKILFRSKKEEIIDEVPEFDGKEEDHEVKQETEEKDSSQKLPSQRPKKTNPYGAWEEVKQEEDVYENVDLELPNVDYDEPQATLPDLPEEPKVKFKEKTITSLGDTISGASVFKKRKMENGKSRNIRQRLNDQ